MMDKQSYTCALVSDFNLQNFAGYIANDPDFPGIKPISAPFGQPAATLLDRQLPCWQSTPDVAVVWTQPQSVVPAFNMLLAYEQVSLQTVLHQVDEYCDLLVEMSERVKYAFVPSWVLPSYRRIFGLLDMQTEIGLTNAIMRMNLKLAENLAKASNIYVLNTHHWTAPAGSQAFSPKLWYLGKIPFGNEVFKEAARDIKAALRGMLGYARKLIIVDLDDTLWGGIVGETEHGQHVGNGIHRQHEIGDGREQRRLHRQRCLVVEGAVIGRERLFGERHARGDLAQLLPEAAAQRIFIVIGTPIGVLSSCHTGNVGSISGPRKAPIVAVRRAVVRRRRSYPSLRRA